MSANLQEPPTTTSTPESGPDLGAALGDLQRSINEGLGSLGDSMAQHVAGGFFLFFGGIGDWLYDTLGPLVSSINIVTQRPEEWTNRAEAVRVIWAGSRTIALVVLFLLVALHLWRWMHSESVGAATDRLADSIAASVACGASAWISLDVVDLLMPSYNALLAWASGGASGLDAVPGWGLLPGADGTTPEGLGKLMMVGQVTWASWHLVQGIALWDVLLMVMCIAIACAASEYTDAWFVRWGTAVGISLVAQFLLCLLMNGGRAVVTLIAAKVAAAGTAGAAAPAVGSGMLLSIGFLFFAGKVAGLTHAGIDVLHPAAAIRSLRGGGKKGGPDSARAAATAASVAVPPAAPAAQAAATATSMPTPVPPAPAPAPVSP